MKPKDNALEKFFYLFDEDKAGENDNSRESKNEFWNKQPTCFRQSSDDPSRLIFRAAARSNYIFDLKMIDGRLQIYSGEDKNANQSIGLKKIPFVKDVDFID